MTEVKSRKSSLRLAGFNYSSEALYAITICTENFQCIFGYIANELPPKDKYLLATEREGCVPVVSETERWEYYRQFQKYFPYTVDSESPGVMKLNRIGEIVKEVWEEIPKHYPVEICEYQIMPNHFHGFINIIDPNKSLEETSGAIRESPLQGRDVISDVGANQDSPLKENSKKRSTLSKCVGYFKMNTSKKIHLLGANKEIWQRDYERQLAYIVLNPPIWNHDHLNPENLRTVHYFRRKEERVEKRITGLRVRQA